MPTKHYEINFIISSKVEEKELEKVAEKIKNLIISKEGKITSQIVIGRKKFAYPIDHQKHGFYHVFEFDLPNEKLTQLNKELKLNKAEILRFLIINKKIAAAEEIPTVEKKAEKIITAQEKTAKAEPKKSSKKKISLDDLDKKLDEILDKEIIQ